MKITINRGYPADGSPQIAVQTDDYVKGIKCKYFLDIHGCLEWITELLSVTNSSEYSASIENRLAELEERLQKAEIRSRK